MYSPYNHFYSLQWLPIPIYSPNLNSTRNSIERPILTTNSVNCFSLTPIYQHKQINLNGEGAFSFCKVPNQIQPEPKIQFKEEKQKLILTKRLSIDDEQFRVQKKKTKQIVRFQKQGRNTFSNIFRSFFRYIDAGQYVKPIIQRIIILHKLHINVQLFNGWIKSKQLDFRNYIRPKIVEKLFKEVDCHPDFNKTLRVLFNYFMANVYHKSLLTSLKMNSKSWIAHLEGARQIIQKTAT